MMLINNKISNCYVDSCGGFSLKIIYFLGFGYLLYNSAIVFKSN